MQLALYGVRFDALAVHSVGETHASEHSPFLVCPSLSLESVPRPMTSPANVMAARWVYVSTELDNRRVGGVYQLNTSACNAVGY